MLAFVPDEVEALGEIAVDHYLWSYFEDLEEYALETVEECHEEDWKEVTANVLKRLDLYSVLNKVLGERKSDKPIQLVHASQWLEMYRDEYC